MMIKVDKNIALEAAENPSKYPWDKLEPGDSFFVPNKSTQQVSIPMRYRMAGQGYSKRKREENGVRGLRVWRVK